MTAATAQPRRRMPAEWEPHRATWIAWPHYEPDWPGKLPPIPWVYGEIARVLADFEQVEILCHSRTRLRERRRHPREPRGARRPCPPPPRAQRSHLAARQRPDRAWSIRPARVTLLNWSFNAWAKYANWRLDAQVGRAIAEHRAAAARRADPARHRRADGARGRRHRDQRRRPAAGHRRVAAEQRAGAQSRADARAATRRRSREWLGVRTDDLAGQGCVGRRHARARRRHRAVRLRATRSCSRSRKTRPTRITRARWTTCGGSSSPARDPQSAR